MLVGRSEVYIIALLAELLLVGHTKIKKAPQSEAEVLF